MTGKSTLLLISALLCLTSFHLPFSKEKLACNVYVPNVFSPNADGVNDVFQPYTACTVSTFDLKIFSRNGSLVFASQKPDEGWDGTAKGKPAAAEVYVYLLKIAYSEVDSAKMEIKTGDVSLIR